MILLFAPHRLPVRSSSPPLTMNTLGG